MGKRAVLTETALFGKRRKTLSIDRDTVLLLIDVQEGFKDPRISARVDAGASDVRLTGRETSKDRYRSR